MISPACTRVLSISFGRVALSRIGSDCGQPMLIGSFIGPSIIICTNSATMKLSSSVVTTSSAPSLTLSTVGPSIINAPATAPAMQMPRIIKGAGPSNRPEPMATAASAPI